MAEPSTPAQLRVDLWLDVSCVYRTRSEAKRACKGGNILVNDDRAKPHREVKPGDRITITTPSGRLRHLVIKRLSERHLPKVEARGLYQDATPPPTPEETQLHELLRRGGPVAGRRQERPNRRERRLRQRLKGR